jgi:hypothetical protein
MSHDFRFQRFLLFMYRLVPVCFAPCLYPGYCPLFPLAFRLSPYHPLSLSGFSPIVGEPQECETAVPFPLGQAPDLMLLSRQHHARPLGFLR